MWTPHQVCIYLTSLTGLTAAKPVGLILLHDFFCSLARQLQRMAGMVFATLSTCFISYTVLSSCILLCLCNIIVCCCYVVNSAVYEFKDCGQSLS